MYNGLNIVHISQTMYVYFMRGWNVCNISLNCFISVMFLPAGGNDMHIFKAGHHAQKKKQIEEKAKVGTTHTRRNRQKRRQRGAQRIQEETDRREGKCGHHAYTNKQTEENPKVGITHRRRREPKGGHHA